MKPLLVSCSKTVPEEALLGTYRVADDGYQYHSLELRRDRSYVERLDFSAGGSYETVGRWIPRFKGDGVAAVEFVDAMMYLHDPIKSDLSNAKDNRATITLEVVKTGMKLRLCDGGCEGEWKDESGALRPIYIVKTG